MPKTSSLPQVSRTLNPYELTHLARYGGSVEDALHTTKPVEYLTGKVEFNGLVLDVTPDTLIPRIETEQLARLATTAALRIAQHNPTLSIADVGTGCGAVILSVTHQLMEADVTPSFLIASDISEKAVIVARHNALITMPQVPISWLVSDLLKEYPPKPPIDLLIANLPYIPSTRIPVLDESVSAYEPWLALDGGEDGLDLIDQLLNTAPAYLSPQGEVLLELDYTHDQAAFAHHNTTWNITVFVDSFSRNRFARCQLRK